MDNEIEEDVCEHTSCYCIVEGGSPYCSLHCEEADEAEAGGNPCGCGHSGCAPEPP